MDDRASDDLPTVAETPPFGMRWATILGATLLAAVAFVTVGRWLGKPAAYTEKIVQVPVPAVTPKPLPPPEVIAPDPGDTP